MALESESTQAKTFSRRAIIIGLAQGMAFVTLGTRLADLQLLDSGQYKTLAENNRIDIQWLPPRRGRIYDRNKKVLAENINDYRVFALPEQIESIDNAIAQLRKIITVSKFEESKIRKRLEKQNRFTPILIRDHLNWDELSAIELRLNELDGIQVRIGQTRSYPNNESGAHVIGYVATPNESDVTDNPLYKIPDVKIGKTGVERVQNKTLLGSPGFSKREVDVKGRIVRELETTEGLRGDDLELTIDNRLQKFMAERLAQTTKSGSATVINVHTGDVLGMVSHPAFDPNKFATGISHDDWSKYRDDIAVPMNNKAISGAYPPGSTFKMVTALAALEAGIIDKDTQAFCPGHFDLGKQRFHCWKKQGHGRVKLVDALAQSCDVYFYELAKELGINRIATMARKMGLGTETNIDLAEEKSGLVPDRSWKRRKYNQPWVPGDTVNSTIGQGYFLTTPLQLAVMVARIVNNGQNVSPRLMNKIGDKRMPNLSYPRSSFKSEHINLIREGMTACVNDRKGTAFGSRIWDVGMEMGGKTGTAQVKRITKAERAAGVRNEDLDWKYRHHALFVGYAPLANPDYAISVVIEHGGGGSSTAAPIARDILKFVQETYKGNKVL